MSETKTLLITGCTDGIGLGCLKRLLGDGSQYRVQYKILATYRNEGKVMAIQSELETIDPNYSSKICFIELDLANIESIRTFCQRVKSKLPEIGSDNIDIVCNNAGMRATRSVVRVQDQNINKCLFVNLLATYYVCRSVITEFNVERVVSLSSVTHWLGTANLATRSDSNDVAYHYANSKIGIFYMTKLLKACFPDTGFVVVNPGFVHTNIFRKVTVWEKIFNYISWLFGFDSMNAASVLFEGFETDPGDRDYLYLSPCFELWGTRFIATYIYTKFYQLNDLLGKLLSFLVKNKVTVPCNNVNNEMICSKYIQLLDKTFGEIDQVLIEQS